VAVMLSVALKKRASPDFQIDVAFEAAPGITILFGESGSGKTTLLRSVAGLTTPDEGRVAVGDRTLFDWSAGIDVPPSRRRMGLVFQHLALFPHLTAEENIAFGTNGQPASQRRQRIEAIAESFRIGHVLGRRPDQISGGERQRVELARALVTDPEVLLLDEPMSALDYGTQSRIMADLRAWNEAKSIPVLYVTHSQRELFALGERAIVIQNGRIVADGTPQSVLETPAHEHVAQLAGFENLLNAVVMKRRPDAGVMVCRLAGTSVDLETPLADMNEGDPLRVALRAGDIIVGTERPRMLSARNVIPATLRSLTREGAVVRAQVSIGIGLEVHVTPTSAEELGLTPGGPVWLLIKTHSCRPVSAR